MFLFHNVVRMEILCVTEKLKAFFHTDATLFLRSTIPSDVPCNLVVYFQGSNFPLLPSFESAYDLLFCSPLRKKKRKRKRNLFYVN